uniref:Uncharacterized protein n=1 Tax=Rhizophagus irregularis (strain DAOM 181602 / DAOM 197198 / MUCL 43194) TaxID=747089 RepID=U9TF15_RHIID
MHRTPSRCRACLVPKLLACPERYKQLLRGLRVRGIIHSFCFLDALTYLYIENFIKLFDLIYSFIKISNLAFISQFDAFNTFKNNESQNLRKTVTTRKGIYC